MIDPLIIEGEMRSVCRVRRHSDSARARRICYSHGVTHAKAVPQDKWSRPPSPRRGRARDYWVRRRGGENQSHAPGVNIRSIAVKCRRA
jgi:hypothetical protein